jgi:penicillin-binding protein 2
MCVVENSGHFGGTYAAPIVGLMIEKYLKDSITDKARVARLEQLSNLNLMPPRIFIELKRQDSMRHSKDSAYLLSKGYIKLIRDTVGIDEDQVDKDELEKVKKEKPIDSKPKKDTSVKSDAILINDKKLNRTADSIKSKKRNTR